MVTMSSHEDVIPENSHVSPADTKSYTKGTEDETVSEEVEFEDVDEKYTENNEENEVFPEKKEIELQPITSSSLNSELDENVKSRNLSSKHEIQSVVSLDKSIRSKKFPSRYDGCMMEEPLSSDVFDSDIQKESEVKLPAKKVKSVKFALDSLSPDGALSEETIVDSSAPSCEYDENRGAAFDTEGNFRFKLSKEHMIRSRTGGLTSYRCDICEMIFPRSFSLRRHYERIHINPRFVRNKGKKDQEVVRKLIDNDRKKLVKKKAKESSECIHGSSANAQTPTNLEKEDTSFYVYACKLCSRYQVFFKTKELLRKHYQNRHTAVARKKMDAFKCESCDRSYMTRHELQRHKRSHSGERPYACRYCAKRFPTSTNARRHERTHTGDRPHICKVCSKRFMQRTDMLKHLRTIHRMKVTRTKAERLRCIDDDPLSDDGTKNQFEENIDFAAYLNLDQFEKGSLMGGSETELQLSNLGSSATNQTGGSVNNPEKEGNLCVSEEPFKDDGLEKDEPHKCPECFKRFSSRVNMRRHYRLKHERNQAVRSAPPVSMVVKKFKIQEAEEKEWKDDIIERIQDLDKMVNKDPEFNAVAKSSSPATHRLEVFEEALPAREKSNYQKAFPQNLFNSAAVSDGDQLKGNKFLGFKSKQGSKLGQILEKLTMKKTKEDNSLFSSTNSASKKENLISSATLLQSMQPFKKKMQLRQDVFTKSPVPQRSSPKINKEKNRKASDANFLLSGNKMRPALDNKIRSQEEMIHVQDHKLRMQKEKFDIKFHPYSRNLRHSWEGSKETSICSGRNSVNGPPQIQAAFTQNRLCTGAKRKELFRDNSEGRQLSNFSVLERRRSFLDDCWSSKMNNIPENSLHFKKSSHLSSPLLHPSNLSKSNSNFSISHSRSFSSSSKDDSPLDLKSSSGTYKEIFSKSSSSNMPLDLSNPKKSSVGYSVTDTGILDLSKKSIRNAYDKKIFKRGNQPKEMKKSEFFNQHLVLDGNVGAERAFRGISQSEFWDPRAEPRSVFDGRDPKHSLTSAPLKFHTVKFNKERRTHGAGTAGRPSNNLYNSNHYRRFSHQGANTSAVINQPFRSQFVEHYRYPMFGSSDSLTSSRNQHNFSMSRFNLEHREVMSRHHKHSLFPAEKPLNPILDTSGSSVFAFSNQSKNISMRSSKPITGYPSPNHRITSTFSRLKPASSDLRKSYPHPYPSNSNASFRDSKAFRSTNFNEDDVMQRCIRKAQHELLQKNATREQANHERETSTINKEVAVFQSCAVKKESFLESDANTISGQQTPPHTSPISFLVPPKQGIDTNLSRDKLTMTPGFDTNGEDEDSKSPQSRAAVACVNLNNQDGMEFNNKNTFPHQNLFGDEAPPNHHIKEIPGNYEKMKLDHKIIELPKNTNVHHLEKSENSIKDLSLSPKKGSSQITKSLGLESEKSPDEPKKFVQKIKLRAVKSQNKDGAKKWTLVEDATHEENNENNQKCDFEHIKHGGEQGGPEQQTTPESRKNSPHKLKLRKVRKASFNLLETDNSASSVNENDDNLISVSTNSWRFQNAASSTSSSASSPCNSTNNQIVEKTISEPDNPAPMKIGRSVSLIMTSLEGCKETCLSGQSEAPLTDLIEKKDESKRPKKLTADISVIEAPDSDVSQSNLLPTSVKSVLVHSPDHNKAVSILQSQQDDSAKRESRHQKESFVLDSLPFASINNTFSKTNQNSETNPLSTQLDDPCISNQQSNDSTGTKSYKILDSEVKTRDNSPIDNAIFFSSTNECSLNNKDDNVKTKQSGTPTLNKDKSSSICNESLSVLCGPLTNPISATVSNLQFKESEIPSQPEKKTASSNELRTGTSSTAQSEKLLLGEDKKNDKKENKIKFQNNLDFSVSSKVSLTDKKESSNYLEDSQESLEICSTTNQSLPLIEPAILPVKEPILGQLMNELAEFSSDISSTTSISINTPIQNQGSVHESLKNKDLDDFDTLKKVQSDSSVPDLDIDSFSLSLDAKAKPDSKATILLLDNEEQDQLKTICCDTIAANSFSDHGGDTLQNSSATKIIDLNEKVNEKCHDADHHEKFPINIKNNQIATEDQNKFDASKDFSEDTQSNSQQSHLLSVLVESSSLQNCLEKEKVNVSPDVKEKVERIEVVETSSLNEASKSLSIKTTDISSGLSGKATTLSHSCAVVQGLQPNDIHDDTDVGTDFVACDSETTSITSANNVDSVNDNSDRDDPAAVDSEHDKKPFNSFITSTENANILNCNLKVKLATEDDASSCLIGEPNKTILLKTKEFSRKQQRKITSIDVKRKFSLRRPGRPRTKHQKKDFGHVSDSTELIPAETSELPQNPASSAIFDRSSDLSSSLLDISDDNKILISEARKKRPAPHRKKIRRKSHLNRKPSSNRSSYSAAPIDDIECSSKNEVVESKISLDTHDKKLCEYITENVTPGRSSTSVIFENQQQKADLNNIEEIQDNTILPTRGRPAKQWARGRKRKLHRFQANANSKQAKTVAPDCASEQNRMQTRSVSFDHLAGAKCGRKITGRGRRRTRGTSRQSVCKSDFSTSQSLSDSTLREGLSLTGVKKGTPSRRGRGREKRGKVSGGGFPLRRSIRNYKNEALKK